MQCSLGAIYHDAIVYIAKESDISVSRYLDGISDFQMPSLIPNFPQRSRSVQYNDVWSGDIREDEWITRPWMVFGPSGDEKSPTFREKDCRDETLSCGTRVFSHVDHNMRVP